MPAAAVIPAPIAYIKVAAVKKLVVGSWDRAGGTIRMPPAVPLNHGPVSENQQNRTRSPIPLFLAGVFRPASLL